MSNEKFEQDYSTPVASGRSLDDKTDKELLLREYELCQNTAQSLEGIIWQTSAVIGIGSIGTFFLVTKEESLRFVVICIISLLVSSASWVWFLMARRWWSIQHANFLRMRHIENTLKIYRSHYIAWLDSPESLPKDEFQQKDDIEEQARKRKYLYFFSAHQKLGIQSVIWVVPFTVTIGWVMYILWRVAMFLIQTLGLF